ncbi:MAG TPA: hypothetical protein VNS63_02925 [Blastocatellia bacterium]|nr:hypothetical protein [Blastocatellia bacterium]
MLLKAHGVAYDPNRLWTSDRLRAVARCAGLSDKSVAIPRARGLALG